MPDGGQFFVALAAGTLTTTLACCFVGIVVQPLLANFPSMESVTRRSIVPSWIDLFVSPAVDFAMKIAIGFVLLRLGYSWLIWVGLIASILTSYGLALLVLYCLAQAPPF